MVPSLIAACIMMVLRYGLYVAEREPEGSTFMLVHILALVALIFFTGTSELRKDHAPGFMALVREGFKAGAVYAMLYGLFIWSFFRFIDTHHFPMRIQQLVDLAVAEGRSGPVVRERLELFFTPFNYTSMTFFALLAFSAVLALAIGAFHHKVSRRFRQ